jgi:hypothetical protein
MDDPRARRDLKGSVVKLNLTIDIPSITDDATREAVKSALHAACPILAPTNGMFGEGTMNVALVLEASELTATQQRRRSGGFGGGASGSVTSGIVTPAFIHPAAMVTGPSGSQRQRIDWDAHTNAEVGGALEVLVEVFEGFIHSDLPGAFFQKPTSRSSGGVSQAVWQPQSEIVPGVVRRRVAWLGTSDLLEVEISDEAQVRTDGIMPLRILRGYACKYMCVSVSVRVCVYGKAACKTVVEYDPYTHATNTRVTLMDVYCRT